MRKRKLLLHLQIILIVIINIKLTTALAQCPPDYELRNGLCFFIGKRCPDGYKYYPHGLCYPIEQKPSPFEELTTTTEGALTNTTTTQETPTTATQLPPLQIDELVRCPSGAVLIENNCRKIICSLGEYYNGNCLYPACPPGLVWRAKSCKPPGYVTTIVEIDNVLTNDFIESPIAIERSSTNEIVYHTSTTTTRKPWTTPAYTTTRTPMRTTTKNSRSNKQDYIYGCCTVVTPRICKKYGEKWICFNRRQQRCHNIICTAPVVYLKVPEIKYEPPVLVMPPNPPIDSCSSGNCNTTDVVDCSGCASNHPEYCSSYCYRYMCPKGTCRYMDLITYCSYYPQQFGCLKEDGCLWNWC